MWDNTKPARYLPNRIQGDAHGSPSPCVLMRTGNQAGKSSAGTLELEYHLTGQYPDWWRAAGNWTAPSPCKARVGIPDFKQHGQEMEDRFRSIWPNWGDRSIWRTRNNQEGRVALIEYLPTGSTCTVLSYKQDLDTWEGWAGDFGWLDEPPPRAHFIALWRGLMARKGRLLITATPLTQPWMHKWLDKGLLQRQAVEQFGWPADREIVEVVTGRIDENPVNTPERIAAFLGTLTEEEHKTRALGEYAFLQGLVYGRHFKPDDHVWHEHEDPPDTWTRYCAIDPHEAKPSVVLYVAVAPWGVHYYYRELVVRGDGPDELARACHLAELGGREPIRRRLIDATSDKEIKVKLADSPDYRLRNWLQAFVEAFEDVYGSRQSFVKVTGSQEAISLCKLRFGDTVYDYADLEVPLIRISPACRTMIDQLEIYQYDEHKGGILAGEKKDVALKHEDDLVDTFHYLEAHGPTFISRYQYQRREARSWMAS